LAYLKGSEIHPAIPALVRMLVGGDAETMRVGSAALGHTRSPSALEPLSTALDDSDVEVKYNAVISLAEITGRAEWRPSKSALLEDPQRYLGCWKDWVAGRIG